jgi:hypothetical protein
MTNRLKQAINCDDGGGAARIIMDALGIKTDGLAKHCLKDVVRDHNGQALAYVYFEDGPRRAPLRIVCRATQSTFSEGQAQKRPILGRTSWATF